MRDCSVFEIEMWTLTNLLSINNGNRQLSVVRM